MGYRHPNPRLVKVHRNYSVEDISRLFGIHKNTVRNWLQQGLPAIDDRRPTLILGRELSRFLHDRRQKAKQSCGPGRIYCIACREPKLPAGKMAECIPTGPQVGNLRGICPDCDRFIYRRVNLAKIDAVRGEVDITFTQPRARLGVPRDDGRIGMAIDGGSRCPTQTKLRPITSIHAQSAWLTTGY